jgi:sugar/nucleoside kinase (ribokinase family)
MPDRKAVLVVGSITQDYVEGPGANVNAALGGSATYFALAARHFVPVSVVGTVGRDREAELRQVLDFADLSRLEAVDKPTYTWRARRSRRDGEATTVERFTGAFDGYVPELGAPGSIPSTIFLGSCDPEVQLAAAAGSPPGAFIGGDTMDIFIESQRPAVERMVGLCSILFATGHELELLAQTEGMEEAAPRLLARFRLMALVVKLGAGGAVLFADGRVHRRPACPVDVVDPTGAGDALAGAFMGRLAERGDRRSDQSLLEAMEWGLVAASFAISGVGVSALRNASRADMQGRLQAYRASRGSSPQA